MNTHTGTYLRPSLADMVGGWLSVGYRCRIAVKELIGLRMAQQNAKGQGNKAKRRAFELGVML